MYSDTDKEKENFLRNIVLRAIKLLNVVLIVLPFVYVWYAIYTKRLAYPFFRRGDWFVIGIYVFCYFSFSRLYSGFALGVSRISELAFSQLIAEILTNSIAYVLFWLLIRVRVSILPLIGAQAAQAVLSVFWSYFSHHWYLKAYPPKKTIIVWDERDHLENLISFYHMEHQYRVISKIHISELNTGLSVLDQAEVVFLSGIHSHERNSILKYCIEKNIQMMILPGIGDVLLSGAQDIHMFYLPMLRLKRYSPIPEYLFMKRAVDIILSLIALVILSPVMLITAAAIKLTDGGSVFYRQTRLTKNGKEFGVLKFRSMRMDAEKDGVARLSTGDSDPRITPVGRFIRAVRIDELPQLINILQGDMSIVGPRPERPEIARQYEESLPEFSLRLQAKAGLTGYAQVYGKYNTTPYDKLLMDLTYIAHPSIIEDFHIMFATVKVLFTKESTEGVEEGKTTAQ